MKPIPRLAGTFALAAAVSAAAGCEVIAFPFFIANEIDKQGTHTEPAQYEGLVGKSFAVLISADRGIQADYPEIVPRLSRRIAEELVANVDVAGYVPGPVILQYQYENPSWSAMAFGEVDDELGVERLVVVDLQEFRLNDPGNRYLYDGVAAASINVVEADGSTPDDVTQELFVRVTFPDAGGFGPEDFSREEIVSVLASRFVNRATWPFYDAEIPNDLAY
ncbi:MAG: hypothetical protein AAGF47_07330 [Planctomycetota bacterium]